MTLLLSGCSQTHEKHTKLTKLEGFTLAKPVDLNNSSKVKAKILSQYATWKGVPYQYGGTTLNGIDCSAFVQNTFRTKLGYNISRTTRTQIKEGNNVSKSQLKVGDVVFFKTGRNSLHNGIYLGNSQFVHASSSKGVTISSLDNVYWKKTYLTSKRIR